VTLEQVLAHPTWDMGPKITVDSATMMNKALEIIEARWLFDLKPDQIEVVIHPQSVVHSLVEFVDGSVVAQMSPPDMKLPIQYALSYPERWECPAKSLDFRSAFSLDFSPPDLDRFPALRLGLEVARCGGTAGAVLNAANEAAVGAFLAGRLRFTEIVSACRAVLESHDFDPSPSLQQLVDLDAWSRKEIEKCSGC
jgi:1-deoxy-D-xylulose-5-phosphate reductoisomerase